MAMLCSLFENNRNNHFVVHILTKDLSTDCINKIERLCIRYNNSLKICNVDETRLEGVQFRTKRPLSKAAYYRLLLSSLIDKEVDRILYLDCDMIVLGDVAQLFSLDLNDYALAATADYMPTNDQHRQQLNLEFGERTFCSGIMMVNLKYWREHNSEKKTYLILQRKHVILSIYMIKMY